MLRPFKSLVAKECKNGAKKFQKRYGSLFRILGVGMSPAGAPTVDLVKINDAFHQKPFQPKGRKITVEKLPDGIFVNGKMFCKEW